MASQRQRRHYPENIKRELYIDTSTNLIVSEKDEYRDDARTYTYNKIERDIDMMPDVFMLNLLPGSELTPYELPVPEPLGRMNMFREPGVSMPRLVSTQEPVYDEASRRAKIEGTVVLYVVIDVSGIPTDIKIFKHLAPGLDASAIQAVKQWRFTPATKNNQRIAAGSMIEVNFRRR